MRRIFVFLFVCLTTIGWAQTATVSGKLNTGGAAGVPSNAFLRFELKGGGGNQCRYNGNATIDMTKPFDLAVNSSGVVSGTVYRNDSITCGSSTASNVWRISWWRNGQGGPTCDVRITSGTFDATQPNCLNVNPVVTAPTGDSTYCRIDATNCGFTGNVTSTGSFAGSAVTATGALTGASLAVASISGVRQADQFASIQAAITAAGTSGAVFVPCGTYTMAGPFASIGTGFTLTGAGKGCVTVNITGTGGVFAFTDLQQVTVSGITFKKTTASGGTFLLCQYCQNVKFDNVDVSATGGFTFVDGISLKTDANGSTIYNAFIDMRLQSVVSANCIHLTSGTIGKTVNANRFVNVVCGPNTGATELNFDTASTATIGENVFINGEFSGGAVGVNVNTAQARDNFFYGPTIESNTGNGWSVNNSAERTQCYGGQIGSNGTNVDGTNIGNRSFMNCNVAGVTQSYSLDSLGALRVYGIGLNGLAPVADGINGTDGMGIQISGANVAIVNAGSFQLQQPLKLGGTLMNAVPVMTGSVYIGGSANSTAADWGTFTPPSAITILRIQVSFASNTLSTCSPQPIIRITDNTSNVNLTLNNGTNPVDSGAVTQNYAAGTALHINTVAGTGCGGATSGAMIIFQYRMQ